MARTHPSIWCLVLLTLCVATHARPAPARKEAAPRVFILIPKLLAQTRERVRRGDAELQPALNALRAQADAALTAGPYSVVDKPFTPPSGDKHDYMSLAIYWWPNSLIPGGKPYVHRDGQRNPEADQYDGARIAPMASHVHTLALAYYLTGHEPYAGHAARLLRGWFLDPKTRMTPHMQYAQGIPGITPGAPWGIIEGAVLATQAVDAAGLLAASPHWRRRDQEGLKQWFAHFLKWMRESPSGRWASRGDNNIAVWYRVQVAAYALFVGDTRLARQTLAKAGPECILKHIEADGRQPAELRRTRSWDYSLYNLDALFALASMGERVGVDLWRLQGEDGRGIRKALDHLVGHAGRPAEWPYQQITPLRPEALFPFLRRAAIAYREPAYEATIASLPGSAEARAANRTNLLYPR